MIIFEWNIEKRIDCPYYLSINNNKCVLIIQLFKSFSCIEEILFTLMQIIIFGNRIMKIVIIVALISLLYSCSPVRTSEFAKGRSTTGRSSSTADGTTAAQNGRSAESSKSNQSSNFERFSDTTFIYLGEFRYKTNESKTNEPLSNELQSAIKLFEDGETTLACERITEILSKINKASNDYYETLFFASECFIAKNSFEPSQRLLVQVLSSNDITDDLKERAIIRLGQVFCVQGDAVSAERLFRQLRREFPKSIYIPIANCDNMGK